jgi:hypothetical protein
MKKSVQILYAAVNVLRVSVYIGYLYINRVVVLFLGRKSNININIFNSFYLSTIKITTDAYSISAVRNRVKENSSSRLRHETPDTFQVSGK